MKLSFRTLIAAGLLLCSSLASAITYVDRSGTITTGGTSQTLAAANPSRGRIAITNHPTETEVLCVNVTSAASCTTPGSWVLAPGETVILDSNELITVVATTTGHKYTAKENITDGFSINVSGSTSISGGAGDASAANQVTGNNTLAAISAKLPTLGTQAIASSQSVTPATSSTWAATQSGTWSVRAQDGSGNAITSAARGSERAMSVQIVDGSGTQITTFGGNIAGSTAHDAVGTSANPVLVGGYASAAAPTNVSADGDAVRAWMLRSGAQAVQPTLGGVLASAGSGANGTGVQRVTIATDDTLMSTINTSLGTINTSINAAANYEATKDSAVPTRLVAMGARTGANADAVAQGATTVAINVSSATTTQLVALSGTTKIYVTGLTVVAGGTGNITFVYGTGTNCGTGTTSLSGAIPLIANAGLSLGSGLGAVMMVPAGQALCVTTSAAVQMSGFVTYAQF